MSVIPITVFFSLVLVGLFVGLFAREQKRRHSSPERESLLPLTEEKPRIIAPKLPALAVKNPSHLEIPPFPPSAYQIFTPLP